MLFFSGKMKKTVFIAEKSYYSKDSAESKCNLYSFSVTVNSERYRGFGMQEDI